MNDKKFRVAICGGGVGGLTCAVALSKYPDVDVDVYEAAATFTANGPGVGVWLRTWRILQQLGLDHELADITGTQMSDDPVVTFNVRKSDCAEGVDFFKLTTKGGLLGIHRADFHRVLLKHLPRTCKTYCSKRLWSYKQTPSGPIELMFEDGSSSSCDILIGADGIKSSVRRSLLREQAYRARSTGRPTEVDALIGSINPVWSGTLANMALISAERLKELAPHHRAFTQPTQYLGKNGYIIVYPISQGKMINITAFHTQEGLENTTFNGPWVKGMEKGALLHPFSQWEPEVQVLLQCVERTSQWAIHTSKPLNSLISGRVVLLGDAAHAMEPHQGAGAGQAIEDAYLLATLLGHSRTTFGSAPRALQVYDTVRRPFTSEISRRNRLAGRQLMLFGNSAEWNSCTADVLKNRLQELGGAITSNWDWAWLTTLDRTLEEAIGML